MRNTKIAAGAVAASAVTALLLGATPAFAQDDDLAPNRAFGIAVGGLLPLVPPTPFVESEDGELVEDDVASLALIPGIAATGLFGELLHVQAEEGHAESSVVRFGYKELFSADLIRTYCDDADGGLEIVGGEFMGERIAAPTVAGEEIDGSPLARLRLGDQVRNADGSVTVTGVELTVLPLIGDDEDEEFSESEQAALPGLGELLGVELPADIGTESDLLDELTGQLPDLGLPGLGDDLLDVVIGSATCTERGDDGKDEHEDGKDDHADDGEDEDEDGDDEDHDAAPRPAVVEASLPVTG